MSECLIWTGATKDNGYGVRSVGGVQWYVHCLPWTEVNGRIPNGLMVLHSCDNRACYALDHLRVGTAKETAAVMLARDRHPQHMRPRERCRKGHQDWRTSGKNRKCRTCEREWKESVAC